MGSDTLEKQQRREARTVRLTILSTVLLFGFILLLCYGLYAYVYIPIADIVSPLDDGGVRQPKIQKESRDQQRHLSRTIKVKNDYKFTISLFHGNIEEPSSIGEYLDDVNAGETVNLQTFLGDVIFATEVNGIRRLEEFKVITKRSDFYILGSKNYASSIFDPSLDVDEIKRDIHKEMERVRGELGKLARYSDRGRSNLEGRQRLDEVGKNFDREPDLKFSNEVFEKDFSHLLDERKKKEENSKP